MVALYLFMASIVWYGKRVRDYWNAFGVVPVLFVETDSILQMQHILPTFAFAFAQTVFAGIFRIDSRDQRWNMKMTAGLICAHLLALISICMPSISVTGHQWLRILYTLLVLAATSLATLASHNFSLRLQQAMPSLRGLALTKKQKLLTAVTRFRTAASLGIAYNILSIIAIAANAQVPNAEQQEFVFVNEDSLIFADLICRDIYLWVTGWTCFCLLQLKSQGINEHPPSAKSKYVASVNMRLFRFQAHAQFSSSATKIEQ